MPEGEQSEASTIENSHEATLKNKRKQVRGRITRSIKRLSEGVSKGDTNLRRFEKELEQLRKDFEVARELHSQFYDLPDVDNNVLDKWEDDLTNDVYGIEEIVEEYMRGASKPNGETSGKKQKNVPQSASKQQLPESKPQASNSQTITPKASTSTLQQEEIQEIPFSTSHTNGSVETTSSPTAFDSWIDELKEFEETKITSTVDGSQMSVADALLKLEASRDIPNITLTKFSGDPLDYADFIDRFKIHIHDKPHLTDDMRMIQLKMHVSGDADRAISGLGSKGIMYVTALRTIKEQFGQPSVIARALVNNLTKGEKIGRSDRRKLREFSIDLMTCLATLKRIGYTADVNANENLRKIVMRLPDHMIEKWRVFVADIREKDQTPTVNHISEFVRKRVKAEFDPDFGDLQRDSRTPRNDPPRKGIYATDRDSKKSALKCYVCEQDHRVMECPVIMKASVPQRLELAKKARLCFSCFNRGHSKNDCRSKKKCEKSESCPYFHHPLLHSDPPSPPPVGNVTPVNAAQPGIGSVLDEGSMMPVVRARFRAPNGRVREGNVLIDSGAGTTVIRKQFAKDLGLTGKKEQVDLAVVGEEKIKQPHSRRVNFWISALKGDQEFKIEAHEIEKTIVNVPELDRKWLSSFSYLRDIELHHTSGPIDLILGVHYTHLHAEEEVRHGKEFQPVAKKTKLGWYVMGANEKQRTSELCSIHFVRKINMEKFYEFETLGVQAVNCSCPKSALSLDDKRAMELMEQSCKLENNRYVIGLPWKRDKSLLPDNRSLAETRLRSLEKSLSKNEEKARMYDEVISQYVANNWATPLREEDLKADTKPVYYLPHHGVYRPDKKSTPLRVVFDPASPYNGVSLNSFLFKGPGLIGNLLGVLLRFREEQVAFSGDISKMFLQILLPKEDTHVHRFLWRNLDTTREPTTYALQRVTFGDKPSPDMASFVMLKMAKENEKECPRAATILKRDRYVDDLIHSCPSTDEAEKSIKEVDTVLSTGSFEIKEWVCSSTVEKVNENQSPNETSVRESDSQPVTPVVNLDGEEENKTLGILWNPKRDVISFASKEVKIESLTKRSVLSNISKLYDPLGLASAVTIKARIALQSVWKAKQFDWDDPLPEDMNETWKKLFKEIESLKNVEFPRCLQPKEVSGVSELHVFADASKAAYGAVAYLVWMTPHGPHVSLVSAKARVAPLHHTTIPRLELMAVLVASRLAQTICQEFKLKPSNVTLWSDSTIVLNWLRSESASFKPFVGVRVAEIQESWSSSSWRYVPSEDNPADDLSRGITVEELCSGRWINGPLFLSKPKTEWPSEKTLESEAQREDIERRKTPNSLAAITKPQPLLKSEHFSDWERLIRVTAYCQRFVNNVKFIKKDPSKVNTDELQPEECKEAENYWIREAQRQLKITDYPNLSPFIEDGLIRVGSRLNKSQLPYEQVNPVLLPKHHHISSLIMKSAHTKVKHAGRERTLCESRTKYWILGGRRIAKDLAKNCVTCRRVRQPPHSTLMGSLPQDRVKVHSPPFTVTGVDLFGPFLLKYGRNKSSKAWGAIFTCATSRAVHLEIVENASAEAFLQALRRFASHHGWPDTVISDNGGSFVGAEIELRKLFLEGKKRLRDFAVLHKIHWKFITPLSPHQGGMYESLIKVTKRALRMSTGEQILSWNEMATIFAEVKSIVNSRPLTYLSDDPNDLRPLTPNHLLLGRASVDVPHGPYEDTKNLHRRFQYVQTLVNNFWSRFIAEYIPKLIAAGRSKWQNKEIQIKKDDIVLIVENNVPRGKWNLGRVLEVFPGTDGIVRNVRVKTENGELKRSIQKCCILLETK